MLRFSLKFCTAIERPAVSSWWPRCCSSAFKGTTIAPPSAQTMSSSGNASGQSCTHTTSGTAMPMATPSGSTRAARARATRSPTSAAPATMPSATAACR